MKHFTAIYQMPPEGLDQWMKTPAEERRDPEEELQQKWGAWLDAHKDSVLNTIALGKTKRVSGNGIDDTKNGMMLSSYVQAESLEEAAELFKDHPHLTLPGASIDVMEANQMTGM